MAISISGSQLVVEASAPTDTKLWGGVKRLAKGGNSQAVIMWSASATTRDADHELYGIVLQPGFLGASTRLTTGDDYFAVGLATLGRIDNDTVGVLYKSAEEGEQTDYKLLPVRVSGATLTPGTSASYDTSTGVGWFGATTDGATTIVGGAYANHQYHKVAISGNTATFSGAETADFVGFATHSTQSIHGMDSSNVLHCYNESSTGSLLFKMCNTTPTLGASSRGGGASTLGGAHSDRISDGKAVVVFTRTTSASKALSLMTVNTSGTTISSFGTPVDIYSTASDAATPVLSRISRKDANSVVVFYEKSGSGMLETFTVSGDTITSNNDSRVISGSFDNIWGVEMTSDILGFAAYQNSLDDILYRSFSISGGSDDFKVLGLDSDDTYLYVTNYYGGDLQCRAHEEANIINFYNFGTVTQADLQSGCYILEPTVDDEGNLFVWGRDGSGSQVHRSTDNGETFSNWSASEWADDDKCVSFTVGNFDDYIAIFESGCIWRTVSGSTGWEKIDDGFTACAVKADRNRENPRRLLASACDAGDVQWTVNRGDDWTTSASIDTTGSTHRIRWVNER